MACVTMQRLRAAQIWVRATDENATDDDGSCLFTGDACDDMDDGTGNDTINESCECVGEGADGLEEGRVTFGMFPNPTTGR